MKVNVSETTAVLPPEAAKRELPYAVVELLCGGVFIPKYRNGDGGAIEFDGKTRALSAVDTDIVRGVAAEVKHELGLGCVPSVGKVLDIHRLAANRVAEAYEHLAGRERTKRVVMLKDKGASGWWRMIMPARHLNLPHWEVDVTASEVPFESLLEYDTVFVQRTHDWESFYVLETLQRAGRRIVYDLDDNLFSITPDNPAWNIITRDNQIAAANCMKLADALTVSTPILAEQLQAVVPGIPEPIVIPNALDTHDRWLPTPMTGSPDQWQRILWSGGASHATDWEQCAQAVEKIMSDRENVRLLILGFLPPAVERMVPRFRDRIEFLGFRDVETYMETIHHVRAEVGLCPLRSTAFNACKSPIKWLEYTLIGMPVVASACQPYAGVVADGNTGTLADSPEGWYNAIVMYLDNRKLRLKTVAGARAVAQGKFEIAKTAEQWRKVLCLEQTEPVVTTGPQ